MALSAARALLKSKGDCKTRAYRMAASTTIYAGGYVMGNSAGLAVPAATGANNAGCLGVALETVTSDASTPTYINVQYGEIEVVASGMAQTNVGEIAYCEDDTTALDAATAATNSVPMGRITEYTSATKVFVDIDPNLNAVIGPHS